MDKGGSIFHSLTIVPSNEHCPYRGFAYAKLTKVFVNILDLQMGAIVSKQEFFVESGG